MVIPSLPLIFIVALVEAQQIVLDTAFLLDSHPKSLQASAINKISDTLTYRLSCPTGTSLGHAACLDEKRYPADITHSSGSVWAGTFTTAAAGVSTIWACALGNGSDDISPNQNGVCNVTIVSGPKQTTTTTLRPDSCYVARHQVPITFTAGLDLVKDRGMTKIGPEELASVMEADANSVCQVGSETDIWGRTSNTAGGTTVTTSRAELFTKSNPASSIPSQTSITQPLVNSTIKSEGSELRPQWKLDLVLAALAVWRLL